LKSATQPIDVLEEQRSAIRALQCPPGNTALSKYPPFEVALLRLPFRASDGDERAMAADTMPMDNPGDALFADAIFAGEHHSCADARRQVRLLAQFSNGAARTY
jgi:hypothetical protein